MHALDTVAALLLDRLAWASLQALILAGVVALVIRLRPNLAPAVRCVLWWLVGLSVIVGLAWRAPIAVPLRTATPVAATVATEPAMHAGAAITTAPAPIAVPSATVTPAIAAPSNRLLDWRLWLAAAWLFGLLAELPRLARQYRRLRELRRNAVRDDRLQAWCDGVARGMGLRRAPQLRVSAAIESPLVSGALRPVILWPAQAALTPAEALLALTHELAHVQRGDLWLALVPAFAQRLFFFHPAVWWAARGYALEREAACDDCVLRQHAAVRADYGRLLLRLGVASTCCAGLASASPTFRALRHRLASLQGARTLRGRAAWVLVAVIAVAGVVPYQIVAARATTSVAHTVVATAPAGATSAAGWPVAVPPPPAPPAPPVPPAPPMPQAPPVPPMPPAPPAPPNPWAPGPVGFAPHDVSLSITPGAPNGLALFDNDSTMISGTRADEVAAKRLRKGSEPLLYLRRGDKRYVVRDLATIKRVEQIYSPMTKLFNQQSDVAVQRAHVFSQRGKFIAQQYGLTQLQFQLAMKRAELQMATTSRELRDASYATTGASQSHVAPTQPDAEQRSLQAQQAELSKRQATLEKRVGAQRAALAQSQRELGAQQADLGKQQRAVTASVQRQMDALVTQAIAEGVAEPVRR